MKQLVSVNLTTRTADWNPPALYFGETLTLGLRFFRTTDGEDAETQIAVESFSALIGDVDQPPRGGKYAIKLGAGPVTSGNTTALVDATATAGQLRAALAAVSGIYGEPRVVAVDGSWLIFFGDQSERVPMEVVHNGLWPISYGRVMAWEVDGKWVHELRLTQTPVAATSSHDVVLPPPPVVTRIQAGGSDPSGTILWNETQELYVPLEFRGAYILKKGFAKTSLLSREDGASRIEEALAALGDGFVVTLPLSQRPAIEFTGDYSGMPHDLLEVEVKQSPPGDVTFSLLLDRAELGAALRVQEEVTLPLEIRIVGTDDAGFEGELVALRLPVVLRRPVTWPQLDERPMIDWLRPFSPKTYVPFGANQFLTGNKFATSVVGDGEAVEFSFATGLGGEMIYVFARENLSGGRQLVHGVDFEVTIDSDNEVTVTALGDAPPTDGWVITAVSAQTIAEWANGLTVTVPQVIAGSGYPSLPDFMDNTVERLVTLEAILPGIGPVASPTSTEGLITIIPEAREVLFYRGSAEDVDQLWGDLGVDPALLPARQTPFMLPAVHNSGPATNFLSALVPPYGDLDPLNVIEGPEGLIGGEGRIRATTAKSGDFVATDGRTLYLVNKAGTSTSYHPRAYERTLFAMAINDKMLSVNRTFEITFGLQLQLLRANCKAQWVLSVQLGTFSADSSPATTGLNLEFVNWQNPVFEQPIVMSRLAQAHFFGIRIKRLLASIKLDQQLYGVWGGNDAAAPGSSNFAIRARLDRFDTENNSAPSGWVTYRLIGALDIDAEGKMTTKPAVASIK